MTQEQASNLITKVRHAQTSLTDEQFTGANAGLTAANIHTAVDTINTVLNGLNQKTIGDVYAIKL